MIRLLRSKIALAFVSAMLSSGASADDLILDLGVHQRAQQGVELRAPVWIQGPATFSGMNLRIELGGEAGSEFELTGAEWSSDEWLNQIPSAERDLIIFTGNGAMEVQWTSWEVNEVQVPAEGGRLLEIILTPRNHSVARVGSVDLFPNLSRLELKSEFLNEQGERKEIRLKSGKVSFGHPEFSAFGLPESGASPAGWNPVWFSEASLTPRWLRNGSLIPTEPDGSSGVYQWRLSSDEGVVFTSDPAVLGSFEPAEEFRLQLVGSHILAHGPVGTTLQLEAANSLGQGTIWSPIETLVLEQSPSVIAIPPSSASIINSDTQIRMQFFRLKKID